jgi:hypothetical protein
MRHALEQMRRIGGFGEMLEDHVEKSHQEMDKFHQRVASSFNMIPYYVCVTLSVFVPARLLLLVKTNFSIHQWRNTGPNQVHEYC